MYISAHISGIRAVTDDAEVNPDVAGVGVGDCDVGPNLVEPRGLAKSRGARAAIDRRSRRPGPSPNRSCSALADLVVGMVIRVGVAPVDLFSLVHGADWPVKDHDEAVLTVAQARRGVEAVAAMLVGCDSERRSVQFDRGDGVDPVERQFTTGALG